MEHEEYVRRVKLMNPIDDDFFKKMAEDVPFCEETIQTIMGDKTIRVVEVKPQNMIKNLQGRSVTLDVLCVNGAGEYFCVEVQKANDDDHQKRVRYNSSCVTANITDPGNKFEKVPNLCSIYITKSDFLKGKHNVYHVDRRIRETGEVLDNGYQEIYVNAQVKDGSLVSELMTIYTDNDAYNYEKFPATSSRKYHFKEDEKGVNEMCDIVMEIRNDGVQEGLERGIEKGVGVSIETCKELNLSYEETKQKILKKLSLSMEEADRLMDLYWQ